MNARRFETPPLPLISLYSCFTALQHVVSKNSLLLLYSCFTHALLLLYSCFTHALLMLYLQHVVSQHVVTASLLLLYFCFTHALLMLYSCCTHALLMLYLCFTDAAAHLGVTASPLSGRQCPAQFTAGYMPVHRTWI